MYAGVVLVAIIWCAERWLLKPGNGFPRPVFSARWIVPACVAASVGLFAVQLVTVDFIAHHQIATPCLFRMPIPIVAYADERSGGPAMIQQSAVLAVVAVLESLVLFLLFSATRERVLRRWERNTLVAGVASSLGVAILWPALTSPDVYLYISFAKVGFAAFSAVPHAIGVPDLPLRKWCVNLLLPSAYGPMFVAYVRALLIATHDPLRLILVLKVSNAVWLLACIFLMRRLGVPLQLAALVAMNPTVLFQYVVNAHNDVIPVTLLVAAMAVDAAIPFLGVAFVVAAALVKLPFAAIGALAFVKRPSTASRGIAAATSIVGALAISYVWAGPAYFAGLQYYQRLLGTAFEPMQALLAAFALAAIVAAVIYRRYAGVAAFAFPALGSTEIPPWYALWGLPYALRNESILPAFAIALPLASLLMDDSVNRTCRAVVYAGVVIAIAAFCLRDLKAAKRRKDSASVSGIR